MRLDKNTEHLLEALVDEYLALPRLDKGARQAGVQDKDVVVRAGIASWSEMSTPGWAPLYREKIRPALLELYRDGLIDFNRLGTTGIWLSRISPTKAGIRHIRLMRHP